MIAAGQPLGVAAPLVDYLGAAMGAAVEQDVNRAGAVPNHNDRLTSEIGGDEIAGIWHLAGMTDEQPSPAEDAFHLQFEQVGIGIDAPVHAAGFDQLGNLVRVPVAHCGYSAAWWACSCTLESMS